MWLKRGENCQRGSFEDWSELPIRWRKVRLGLPLSCCTPVQYTEGGVTPNETLSRYVHRRKGSTTMVDHRTRAITIEYLPNKLLRIFSFHRRLSGESNPYPCHRPPSSCF